MRIYRVGLGVRFDTDAGQLIKIVPIAMRVERYGDTEQIYFQNKTTLQRETDPILWSDLYDQAGVALGVDFASTILALYAINFDAGAIVPIGILYSAIAPIDINVITPTTADISLDTASLTDAVTLNNNQYLIVWDTALSAYRKIAASALVTSLLQIIGAVGNPALFNPAAPLIGDTYIVDIAGTLSLIAGTPTVEIGDTIFYSAAGWHILQANLTQATETNIGYAELATQIEVNTGTDDLRIVTPLKLATLLGSYILQNGNSFAAAMTIGTNDLFALNLETNAIIRFSISSAGVVNVANLTSVGNRLTQANSAGDLQLTTIDPDLLILQNGNTLASSVVIGSNDNFNLIFEANAVNRIQVETDGTMSALTAAYETLVLNDNDIPNRKFITDLLLGYILQNGNSFASAMTIGTNDLFALNLETNAIIRFSISSAGVVNVANLTSAGNRLTQANSAGDLQLTTIDPALLILQNGNTFAANVVIGANDTFNLQFETNAITRLTISAAGVVNVANLTSAGNRLTQANSAGDLLLTTIDPVNLILQNGNTLAANVVIGSNDAFNLIFETNAVNRIQVETDGTLSALTAAYETLVLANNDIPNKKYVDDSLALLTASNGITRLVNNFKLGGSLIENTTIAQAAFNLFLNGTTGSFNVDYINTAGSITNSTIVDLAAGGFEVTSTFLNTFPFPSSVSSQLILNQNQAQLISGDAILLNGSAIDVIATQIDFTTAGINRFVIENNGTLHSNTAAYEALITDPNDIPNKQYVDNRVNTLFARQTVTTGTINWASGALVTMNLVGSVGNITLTLTNPQEATYSVTVIDHTTTARAITFPTNTKFASDYNTSDFTVVGLVLTPVAANTRYKIQLEYHGSDPVHGVHYEVVVFKINP